MNSFTTHLKEDKTSAVNKMRNLSRHDKKRIIKFFKKNSTRENEIDWNDKSLDITDFQLVLHSRSKTKVKKDVKSKGISGLKKWEDYIDVSYMFDYYYAYIPLSLESSRHIANKYIGRCVGNWCTAYAKDDKYWKNYTNRGVVFVYLISYDGKDKYALAIHKKLTKVEIFDKDDTQVNQVNNINVHNIIKKNKKKILSYTKDIRKQSPHWIEEADVINANYETSSGTFTWNSGTWRSGTWKTGYWKSGTWLSGKWIEGMWMDGLWHDGFWYMGSWMKGEWRGGVWYDGFWYDGTWKGGVWKKGEWAEGSWLYGLWTDGLWQDGSWKYGIWHNGAWLDGTWYDGFWKRGTWHSGIWHDGVWEKGDWIWGIWKDGEWVDGVWHNGTWQGGIWKNGVWMKGVWQGGEWKSGLWESGTWQRGTWKGGTWLGGYDKQGNYHPKGDSPDKWSQ